MIVHGVILSYNVLIYIKYCDENETIAITINAISIKLISYLHFTLRIYMKESKKYFY